MASLTRRTRKVTSNGWWYRLARHSEKGLVLLDSHDQSDVEDGQLRAFVMETQRTEIFDRAAFKVLLGGVVSDADFVRLMTRYNSFKEAAGRPIKAPPEVAHSNFLEARGLPAQALRVSTRRLNHRVTHCYACKAALDNSIKLECTACNWIICSCGACGCGCGWTRGA